MSKTTAEFCYVNYKDKFFGVVLTKHFFERFFERFNINDLKSILSYLNKNVCVILYELAMTETQCLKYKIDDAVVPVKMTIGEDNIPKIIVKTVYKVK